VTVEYRNALPLGTRIAEYRLESVLGAGGFGVTYLAHDENLDMRVAIKEYLPADVAVRERDQSVHPRSDGDRTTYEWGLGRFREEAQTLARFSHPHIVRVLRFLAANNTAYMVMQYEDGESLRALLSRRATLTEDELRALLDPLLDGLVRVHAAGILHRDIKPGNIYVRRDGSPVLLDFGAARQAMGERSRSMTAVLTPPYAPIEQYGKGQPQGPWTDIYAFGVVVYEALSGRQPPDATDRVMDDRMAGLTQAASSRCSVELVTAVTAALEVKGASRPQTVEAWRAMLRTSAPRPRAVAPAPSPARVVPPADPASGATGARSGRWRRWALGVAAALCGSAAVTLVGEWRSAREPDLLFMVLQTVGGAGALFITGVAVLYVARKIAAAFRAVSGTVARVSSSSRFQLAALGGTLGALALAAYVFWPEVQRFFTSAEPPAHVERRTVSTRPAIPMPPVVLPPEIPPMPKITIPEKIEIPPMPTIPEWAERARQFGQAPVFSPTRPFPDALPGSAYRGAVDRKVKQAWTSPGGARAGQEAVAVVDIGRDGTLARVALEKTSGDAAYDQAALAAIAKAMPFPPLPDDVPDTALRVRLHFTTPE
jgi:TonB family protein